MVCLYVLAEVVSCIETMLNVPKVILRLNFKIIKLFSELYAYEIKFIKLKILLNKRGISKTDR